MAGRKGELARSEGGKQQTVYLSDKFGIWLAGKNLHLTFLRDQSLHNSISPKDGILYDAFLMLYKQGLRTGK